MLRLWRIIRLLHGVFTAQHERNVVHDKAIHTAMVAMEKQLHQLQQTLTVAWRTVHSLRVTNRQLYAQVIALHGKPAGDALTPPTEAMRVRSQSVA